MSIFLVSPCHAHIHNSRSIPMNGCFDCVHCAYGGLAKTIYLRSIYEVFFLADQASKQLLGMTAAPSAAATAAAVVP